MRNPQKKKERPMLRIIFHDLKMALDPLMSYMACFLATETVTLEEFEIQQMCRSC